MMLQRKSTSGSNSLVACWCCLACVLFIVWPAVVLGQGAAPAFGDTVMPARPQVAPDLNADGSVDVDAMDKYEAAILELLNENKFESLEQTAATLRADKSRFVGGPWKLFIFYRGLRGPTAGNQANDGEWTSHLARLEAWAERKPDSVTARIALAEAFYGYSQKAALDEQAAMEPNKDNPDAGKQAAERLHMAKLMLQEAANLPTKCPHYYFVKQKLTRMPSAALFKEARTFEPTYYYFYRMQALQLHLYSDDPDAAEKFADEMASQVGGDEGAIIYYEIAAALNANTESRTWPAAKLSWPRVQQGFAAMEKRYGASVYKTNQMALLAVKAQDIETSKRLLAQLGDKWATDVWGTKEYFAASKVWASAPSEVVTLLQTAAANQATPEGQQYYKTAWNALGHIYGLVFRNCMQPYGQERPESFHLLVEVSGEGDIQALKAWPQTKLSACLTPSLLNGKLGVPPRPSFWLDVPFHFQNPL